jgi:hypothetical protein
MVPIVTGLSFNLHRGTKYLPSIDEILAPSSSSFSVNVNSKERPNGPGRQKVLLK